MPDARVSSRTSASRMLSTVLLCGSVYCGTQAADTPPSPASETVYQVGAATRRLDVRDSDSVLVQFPEWLTRVRSGNADMVRVTAVRPDCLRITRLAAGRTTLTAVDRQQREYSVELSLPATHPH